MNDQPCFSDARVREPAAGSAMTLSSLRPAGAARRRLPGCVFLVGAGPGDPELLTLKAMRAIGRADALLHDHLVSREILALARPQTQLIYVGKQAGRHAVPQEAINALLVQLSRAGKCVVRLKGGDPFIFGRGGEEAEALAAQDIPFEVIPGITSASGVSCCAGIPLTHRDHAQALVFVTGHLRDGAAAPDWEAWARPRQTLVIYMGLGALAEICRELVSHGLPASTPGAVVEQGTTPGQRIVVADLDTLADQAREAGIRPPALIIIGEVVALRERLAGSREAHPVAPVGAARILAA
jgi:uroporphyrin-III C-methyltransferase